MNLNIVYQDQDILVLDKPSGTVVHRTNPTDPRKTFVDWVTEKYPEIKSVGENPLRPGLVHRLDKATSGLIILARNQRAFLYFKDLFQKKLIKKTYLALVHGRLEKRSGTIDLPLGKIGYKQTTRIKGHHFLDQKTAITNYLVLREYPHFSLLKVSPLTGRTHQIRIHLKSIGHPIVCDLLYGGKRQICPPELNRLFLHAQKLAFILPSGQALTLETDPPQELTDFLNSFMIAQ